MKAEGMPIAMLTAYDFPFARIFDNAGVDVMLVGDSLGMVVQGADSTLPVTQLTPATYQVSFLLSATEPVGPAQQIVVYVDGRSSYPVSIPIARPDGTVTVNIEGRTIGVGSFASARILVTA